MAVKDGVAGGDIEVGHRPLYPAMAENPGLRWAFIRKVYAILTFQLLTTVAVAATVVSVNAISNFFVSTTSGLALYICITLLPLIGVSFFFFEFSLVYARRTFS